MTASGRSGAHARPSGPLRGEAVAPGDKSISHRALLFSAMAEGEAHIRGLLEGEDVLRTAAAMRALGREVERSAGVWSVKGGPFAAPTRAIYCGNSGTSMRLLAGALAGRGVAVRLDGDASLRARPMKRVSDPLAAMGADIQTTDGRAPVMIAPAKLRGMDYVSPKASAQVKSAVLLAGLCADGATSVTEPTLSRDHTERMLAAMGVALEIDDRADGSRLVRVQGGARLSAIDIDVPGDPSSAAFLAAAAAIVPGSNVTIRGVCLNAARDGFFRTLKDMGARVEILSLRDAGGEPVGDVRVAHGALRAVRVPPERAASMIDEYPILAVVAAYAEGETRMEGVGELRVKESDRIAAMEAGLAAVGVATQSDAETLIVRGGAPKGGARVEARLDHRIAMSFLVLGLGAEEPVDVDDAAPIATSFPGFFELFRGLGGAMSADGR